VREGSVFPLRLVIRSRSEASTPGTIDLLLNGDPVARQPVELEPGVNVFEIPYQLNERGSYRLAARVFAPGDEGGHRRELSLAVAGPIRALVVSEARDPALARALRLKDVDVEFARPAEFPGLEDLLQYHCVILDDVPRKALPDEAPSVLESYVRNFGGGFLMAGGIRSFGDKQYQESPVERILPVRLVEQKPSPKGRAPMGVFLLVDRSNSMSYNSRRRDVRDGEKMSYAKEAARALVGQLRPEDRVGVIAFDSDPYVLGPLKPLSEHRNTLNDRIARLLPGGGTDFKASLEIAAAQLAGSGLGVRHVILLTDGDTNRGAKDHESLIGALGRMAISVTTIRIGDDDVNLELLRDVSSRTGGRFYHVQNIERLPQLIVSDTQRRGDTAEEEPEEPQSARYPLGVGEPSPVVQGFDEGEFPVLRQLVDSHLKRGADEVLYGMRGPKRVPLLSTWQYGLGRTAAFTLDPTTAEGASWVSWPGFGKLWSQLVRWAIREETPWETRQSVRFEEGQPVLEVQTFDHREEGTITAQIFTAPQASVELQLVPVAPRLFRAPLPPLPPGRYALLLTRSRDGKPLAQKRDVLLLDASLEEEGTAELARKLPDLDLLREITAETGGSLNPGIEELTARRGATQTVRRRLDHLLVPLALALFLGDIWIRRRIDS
ncbi:MAG: VWA domain-containing protein, partial [Candidatus Binatia bacterium]